MFIRDGEKDLGSFSRIHSIGIFLFIYNEPAVVWSFAVRASENQNCSRFSPCFSI